MKEYNKLVSDRNQNELVRLKQHNQDSWKEIVKFFGSEKEAIKHYERQTLDDLDKAYRHHLERGGEPIKGFDERMKKEFAAKDKIDQLEQ